MKKYLLAALAWAVVLAATPAARAQVGPPPPPQPLPSGDRLFEAGSLDGSVYTNRYFGVTFTAPKGWVVIDPDLMKKQREQSKALLRDEKNEQLKRQLEDAVDRTVPLFSASRLPPGTAGSFNATLLFAAERVPTAVVKTPRDFYTLMLHSMNLTQGIKVEVVEPFREQRVGTTSFGAYAVRITANAGVVMQKQFMAVKGAYVYGLVFTYVEQSDTATFEEVLRSLKAP